MMAKNLFVTCSAMIFIKSKHIHRKANKHFFYKIIYDQLVCNFTKPLQTKCEFGQNKNLANKQIQINFTFA